MITASKYELAMRCPGAFALPHRDERTEAAAAGIAMHERIEREINAGDIPALLAERWPAAVWAAEDKYAIDVATGYGRRIAGGARAYGNPGPFEIVGTIDAFSYYMDRVVVVDFKSHGPITHPRDNGQLHILALAAARSYGLSCADIAIHHEIHGLTVHTLDAFDLECIELQAQETLGLVAAARLKIREGDTSYIRPGSHCRYCPAFAACPKQAALIADVDQGVTMNHLDKLMPLHDDATAAEAYEFAKRCRILLKRLDQVLYARAKDRPIPLRDGKFFGVRVRKGNEQLDGKVAHDVLLAEHGQELADAAVTYEVTKSGIRAALSEKLPRGSLAAGERKIIELIREAGGSKRPIKEAIEEYEPKLELVE